MTPGEEVKEQPNSCEISVNAKGQYSGKIKVYAETIEEAFDKSEKYAKKVEDLIKEKNQ